MYNEYNENAEFEYDHILEIESEEFEKKEGIEYSMESLGLSWSDF